MSEAVVFLLGADHFSFFIQHQLNLRQLQHDLPLLQPAFLNALGQHVHLIEQLDHIGRIIDQPPRALWMWNRLRLIDDRLRLAIAQTLG